MTVTDVSHVLAAQLFELRNSLASSVPLEVAERLASHFHQLSLLLRRLWQLIEKPVNVSVPLVELWRFASRRAAAAETALRQCRPPATSPSTESTESTESDKPDRSDRSDRPTGSTGSSGSVTEWDVAEWQWKVAEAERQAAVATAKAEAAVTSLTAAEKRSALTSAAAAETLRQWKSNVEKLAEETKRKSEAELSLNSVAVTFAVELSREKSLRRHAELSAALARDIPVTHSAAFVDVDEIDDAEWMTVLCQLVTQPVAQPRVIVAEAPVPLDSLLHFFRSTAEDFFSNAEGTAMDLSEDIWGDRSVSSMEEVQERREIEDAKLRANAAEAQRQAVEKHCHHLEVLLQRVHQQYQQSEALLREQIRSLEHSTSTMSLQEQLRRIVKQLSSKISPLQKDSFSPTRDLEHELWQLQSTLSNLQFQLEEEKMEKQKLTEELNALKQRTASESQLEERRSNHWGKDTFDGIVQEKEQLRRDCLKLQQENENLMSRVERAERDLAASISKRATTENSDLANVNSLYKDAKVELKTLQARLESKEQSILKLRELLQSTRQSHIEELQEAKKKIIDLSSELEFSSTAKEEDHSFVFPSQPPPPTEPVLTVAQVDEMLLQKELQVKDLQSQLNDVMRNALALRQQTQENEVVLEQKDDTIGQLQENLHRVEQEKELLTQFQQQQEEELQTVREKLQREKEFQERQAAEKPEKTERRSAVEQRNAKDRHIKKLEEVIIKLKAELVHAYEKGAEAALQKRSRR